MQTYTHIHRQRKREGRCVGVGLCTERGGGPSVSPSSSTWLIPPCIHPHIPTSPPTYPQYLQASGSAPKLSVKDLGGKWHGSLRAALLHRYGVTAQDLVDVSTVG